LKPDTLRNSARQFRQAIEIIEIRQWKVSCYFDFRGDTQGIRKRVSAAHRISARLDVADVFEGRAFARPRTYTAMLKPCEREIRARGHNNICLNI
jgi:hypothetical protein